MPIYFDKNNFFPMRIKPPQPLTGQLPLKEGALRQYKKLREPQTSPFRVEGDRLSGGGGY